MPPIAKALRALPPGSYLLAVSGGRDSMALLHAFAAERRGDLSAVATFDHGTGPAAAEAVELVIQECLRLGVSVIAGRAPERPEAGRLAAGRPEAGRSTTGRPTEGLLREARWTFLRAAAEERAATIVTAHTMDDQAETVAMRILRGASARGLAGMASPTPGVVRPLLGVSRAALAAYAAANGVRHVEDPTNAQTAYLRNRLRGDVLGAVESRRPGFRDELISIGARAAQWRAAMVGLVDALDARRVGDSVVIDADALAGLARDALAVAWPEIAGRAGVVLDRRGVERLSHWTPTSRAGQRVPLSGGGTVERTPRTFVVRPARETAK
ncbi:MAG: tRNA lysidine(34) synthetase TilS [Gemmatimonadetes bacterium]|nr:tRNA lysidine(34) synthetase TilS [Gemmatimonadota bacterium]